MGPGHAVLRSARAPFRDDERGGGRGLIFGPLMRRKVAAGLATAVVPNVDRPGRARRGPPLRLASLGTSPPLRGVGGWAAVLAAGYPPPHEVGAEVASRSDDGGGAALEDTVPTVTTGAAEGRRRRAAARPEKVGGGRPPAFEALATVSMWPPRRPRHSGAAERNPESRGVAEADMRRSRPTLRRRRSGFRVPLRGPGMTPMFEAARLTFDASLQTLRYVRVDDEGGGALTFSLWGLSLRLDVAAPQATSFRGRRAEPGIQRGCRGGHASFAPDPAAPALWIPGSAARPRNDADVRGRSADLRCQPADAPIRQS
jgi:hypothetical protein